MRPAIQAHALTKRYRRTTALDDLTISVPAGRTVALVGPNGAGKTTLLRVAIGLSRPTKGTIRTLGLDPIREERDLLQRVAFLSQVHPLYNSYTVADMLEYAKRMNRHWDSRASVARIERLAIPPTQRVGALSGGQHAQLALTLALGKRPELLLLDEPLASLDPLARREFLSTLMEAVANEGMTVVLSSHDLAGLERVCDDVLLLSAAHAALCGEIEDIVESHRRIVGPGGGGLTMTGVREVVETETVGQQTTAIVSIDGEICDPEWDVTQVTLEDIVLAYLGMGATRKTQDRVEVLTQ